MGRVIRHPAVMEVPLTRTTGDPLVAVLVEAAAVRRRLQAQTKEALVEVALHMAGRIVHDAIATTPQRLEVMYAEAIRSVAPLQPGVLWVHDGADLVPLQAMADPLGFEVRTDPALQVGDCVVEVQGVRVDHRLSVLLEVFSQALGQTP